MRFQTTAGVLLALLLAPTATAQDERWVLVSCDAQMRSSILETSSILDADPERCRHVTGGQHAWQALLRSRHGDLVKVSTVPSVQSLGNGCAPGPFETLPGALELYVPADSLIATVTERTTARTKDKRSAILRPGAAVRGGKGGWYTASDGRETAKIKLTRKQVRDEFPTPPKGPCVAFDPVGDADPLTAWRTAPIGASPWVAPTGTIIYLPTMEQVGETVVDYRVPAPTFDKGMLTCTDSSPLRFAQQGVAPLCFLTLALNPAG